jgi:DNA-binding CsgD family transcriptional regulator
MSDTTGRRSRSQDLTERQAAVLGFIELGLTNKEIAQRLGISENGVKGHVARLLSKFDVPSRAALAASARREAGVSGGAAFGVLRTSLEEVVGRTATAALLKRAAKRANLGDWKDQGTDGLSGPALSALMRELWPVLIEMTGEVLVDRLRSRGFQASGEVVPAEVVKWLR